MVNMSPLGWLWPIIIPVALLNMAVLNISRGCITAKLMVPIETVSICVGSFLLFKQIKMKCSRSAFPMKSRIISAASFGSSIRLFKYQSVSSLTIWTLTTSILFLLIMDKLYTFY
uniref:Uncharacterized protein n=3 Tax=Staphylococcus TaxID=1279 RepID=Q933S6_STAAU|nr:DNA repair protein RadC [Staphylococcus cohnii]ARX60734.1 Hypothetical protein [Staphylococcus epidermidis]BAB47604.1 hypothetical protein [Staphylococcus aureus]BAQ35732.1 hypothetical protein [Staphylococcus aureus]